MFDSARIHGTDAEYPMMGFENPPLIVTATWPLVNGCPDIFTPGTPRVVASFEP
jgi:hypothetical protein